MPIRVVVGFAGLDIENEDRLRVAGKLLSVFKIEALIQPWGQTGCDVLVARVDTEAGRSALREAGTRTLPVVTLRAACDSDTDSSQLPLSVDAPMHKYLDALRAAVAICTPASSGRAAVPAGVASEAGLCLLASQDELRGQDVRAIVSGRRIIFRPGLGKVYANSLSDLITAREHLVQPGWVLSPRFRSAPGEVSLALDGFLLQGAMARRQLLPAYPDVLCYLLDWPDLGGVSDVPMALEVAGLLIRRSCRPAEVAAETGQAYDAVAACLWAFRAAGLLQHAQTGRRAAVASDGMAAKPASFTGVLAKIAHRFGISRAKKS